MQKVFHSVPTRDFTVVSVTLTISMWTGFSQKDAESLVVTLVSRALWRRSLLSERRTTLWPVFSGWSLWIVTCGDFLATVSGRYLERLPVFVEPLRVWSGGDLEALGGHATWIGLVRRHFGFESCDKQLRGDPLSKSFVGSGHCFGWPSLTLDATGASFCDF